MKALLAALVGALAVATSAAAAASQFRYERPLRVDGSGGPFRIVPDAQLIGHTSEGFADLRIFDARGVQVPWRTAPVAAATEPRQEPVRLLDVGRAGGRIVALIDLGPAKKVRSQIQLTIPGHDFVGHVTVLGGDDRTQLRRLSRVAVWDIHGASHSRSTLVVFPPSDLRYLELHADGIPRLLGATVSGLAPKPKLAAWHVEQTTRRERGNRTVVILDLGLSLPVDAIEVTATTGLYDRSLGIAGSNEGRTYDALADGRLFRYPGARSGAFAVSARARYLRLTVGNGDDRPLGPLRIEVRHAPAMLLVRGDEHAPYTLRYGAALAAPSYDFALLPASALGLGHATAGALGPEVRLRAQTVAKPRSYRWLAVVGLAVAALAVAGAGLIVLRRTTPT